MQISIKGKQLDVGDALRGHATTTLEQAIVKYFEHPLEATVMFSREAHQFTCDVTVHPMSGYMVQGSAHAGEVYAALDMAVERIAKQLRRYKRRLETAKTRPLAESRKAQQFVLAGGGEEAEAPPEADNPVIVAEMTADIPTCTVSDAVMRLDLGNLSVVMFRNKAHGGLNVVYRRPDGNVGWIDPGQTG
jgi:ribosomal subunit interface protein